MNCIAHRGFAGVNPENTLAAVRDAVERRDDTGRADAVEVDVRRCGSGELVACHDATVDRTTDGSGAVGDHTAGELAALSVEGSDAGVPTARSVLEAVPEGVVCHAELKERVGAGLETLVADVDPDCEVVVSSFDADALAGVDSPPRAWLVVEAAGAVDRALELDCEALHPAVDVCDRALVERAHDAGLAVNAWTVTDPAETRRLRNLSVDGVITDFPGCCPARG
ncbi:MAG: glycerophosphodiester phosphodiesterase [Haloarculaceae archaeon]